MEGGGGIGIGFVVSFSNIKTAGILEAYIRKSTFHSSTFEEKLFLKSHYYLKMEKVMLPFFVVTVFVTLCSGSRDPRIGGLSLEDEGEGLLSRYLSPDARTKRDTDPKGTDLCNEAQLTEVVSEHNACYKKAESQLTEAFTSGERQFLLWLLIMLLE
jgi:hypothetical protein